MEDYSKDKKILDLMSTYKSEKEKEKNYKETAKNKILCHTVEKIWETHPELQDVVAKETVEDILECYTESKATIGTEKKEIDKNIEFIQNSIGEIIEEDVAENQKEKTIILNKLGTIKCTFEKEYYLAMNEEQQADFIDTCIEEGRTNLLKINEDALFAFSERVKQATGAHIEGVGENRKIVTKITAARS